VPGPPIQPLAVSGLKLAADARTMVLLTLPAVQWEPVECEATGDDPSLPSKLRFDNSGVPTTIDVPTVRLVPVTPEAALEAITGAFAPGEDPGALRARMTLPFGMVAQATLSRPTPVRGPEVRESRPASADGLQGGRQLTIRAADPWLAPGQSPGLPGFAVQLPVAHPGPRSVLGASVTSIFNSYLGAGSSKAEVPITRIDLSGFGESLFSHWNNPGEDLPQVSKAAFHVLLGRTAYEVVQVKTFKLPFFTPMVKTITFTRRSNGSVYRQESDWTALGDGRFAAPTGSGVLTHPGVVRRLTRVSNVRETGRRVSHGGIDFAEVRYDGLVELEGSNPALVPVRGHVGFLQVEAVPLTAPAYAALIAAEGSLCGTMDAALGVAGGPQRMRVHRIGVGTVETGAGPEFAMVAWGGLAFPGGGEWSVLRAEDAVEAPGPVPEGEGLPLIRAGAAPGPSVGPYRFADPGDLARPTAPERDYGILHATGTQRAFFRRPRIEPADPSRIVSEERPVIADPYVLATALGPFPRQVDCIRAPAGTWALAIGAAGSYRLDLPGGPTFVPGLGRRTMRQAGSVKSDLDYSASQVTYELDTANLVPWRFALTKAARIMNHANMGDVFTLSADVFAEAGRDTVFVQPALRVGGALQVVQDVLTILQDLGIAGTFRTTMTNGWSLNAKLTVPIADATGQDLTIPPAPINPAPLNYTLIFSDSGINVGFDITPSAETATLEIEANPMFGTSKPGLYVAIIVKFTIHLGTDTGTHFGLLIGIGLAVKFKLGPFEAKGLIALTFFGVTGDTLFGYGIGFLLKLTVDFFEKAPILTVEVSVEGKKASLTVRKGQPDETVFSVAKLVLAVEATVCLVLSISIEHEWKAVCVVRGPLGEEALPDVL
jgi:hypothetical protein